MPVNGDFDASKFLYYNPLLTAESNLITPTDAHAWALSNDTMHLLSNDSMISRFFDPRVFVADFKSNLDVSLLNRAIYQSMIREGFTDHMLDCRTTYANNIYQDAHIISTNTFKFNNLQSSSNVYVIKPTALNLNDEVQIQHNTTKVIEYGRVVEIQGDHQTFVLHNPKRVFTELGESYNVLGIKVYDLERIARINCLRHARVPPYVPPHVQTVVDPGFNPDLYRLLYPNARELGDLACFQDYVQRRDKDEYRIRNADDLGFGTKLNNLGTDSNTLAYGDKDHTTVHSSLVVDRHLAVNGEISAKSLRLDEMNVTNVFEDVQHLNVDYRFSLGDTSSMIWRDVFVRGITQDGYRKSGALDPAEDNLITEWAIKSYVDRSYRETAVFNEMDVSGATSIQGELQVTSAMAAISNVGVSNAWITSLVTSNSIVTGISEFEGSTYYRSNVVFQGDSLFTGVITSTNSIDAAIVTSSNIESDVATITSQLFAPYAHITYLDTTQGFKSETKTQLEDDVGINGNMTVTNKRSSDAAIFDIPSSFLQPTRITSNLSVTGRTTFAEQTIFSGPVICNSSNNVLHNVHASNMIIDKHFTVHSESADFKGDILCQGSMLGPSIGIGPSNRFLGSSPSILNASVCNLDVKGRLEVGPVNLGIAAKIHGMLEADNFPTASDMRVKKDVEPMGGLAAAIAVKNISSIFFRYSNEPGFSRRHLGFSANDVETVLPEAVVKVPGYSYTFSSPIRRRDGLNRIEIMTECPKLDADDTIILEDGEAYRIVSAVSTRVFDLDKPVPRDIKSMNRIVFKELRTIDYTFMLSTLYAAVGYLINTTSL